MSEYHSGTLRVTAKFVSVTSRVRRNVFGRSARNDVSSGSSVPTRYSVTIITKGRRGGRDKGGKISDEQIENTCRDFDRIFIILRQKIREAPAMPLESSFDVGASCKDAPFVPHGGHLRSGGSVWMCLAGLHITEARRHRFPRRCPLAFCRRGYLRSPRGSHP